MHNYGYIYPVDPVREKEKTQKTDPDQRPVH
jgi:hypothetical protein